MKKSVTLVETAQGDVSVITNCRFMIFLRRPRTSIMPHGFDKFGRQIGFQVVYNTSEPAILAELHDFFVETMAAGEFNAYKANSKMGLIEFPPDKQHLRKYVIGFRG